MVASLLIKGNVKMGKDVYLYNLPPKKTCSPTHWCLKGRSGKPACYALRNNFLLPSVVKAASERFDISQQDDFADRMVDEIHKRNVQYFRFHASGDFYSEKYVEKIMKIAESCPETLFRTTTRRRDLTGVIGQLNGLPNFIVRESLDVERSSPEMGLPFAAIGSLSIVDKNRDELHHCLDDCIECGYNCWENESSIYFNEF